MIYKKKPVAIDWHSFLVVTHDVCCWQTIESLTVYCFGHLVYEMSTGKPLETLHCDNISYTFPYELSTSLDWPTIVLQCFDTVGWVIWPVKIVPIPQYDLWCVWWDVKPYSTTKYVSEMLVLSFETGKCVSFIRYLSEVVDCISLNLECNTHTSIGVWLPVKGRVKVEVIIRWGCSPLLMNAADADAEMLFY